MKIYVAGPLTHLKNEAIKDLYIKIGEMARELGIDAVVPHKDVEQSPDLVTPQFIYHADTRAVREADLLIAYIGDTSLGVGMELEVANQNNTLFITFCEKDTRISRMVLGSPNLIEHIEFESIDEVLDHLRPTLERIKQSLRK